MRSVLYGTMPTKVGPSVGILIAETLFFYVLFFIFKKASASPAARDSVSYRLIATIEEEMATDAGRSRRVGLRSR